MNIKEMDKLIAHFGKYFEQKEEGIIHPTDMTPHIDVLKYAPTGKYPFWKLVTLGASDYKMPGKQALGNYNEYMIFVDADEDLNNKTTLDWYYTTLLNIALFPVLNKTAISYGHSIEWKDDGTEMVGAYLEFPQIIEDTGILRCRLGLLKTVICLQAIFINRAEMDLLLEKGPEAFSEYLYPDRDDEAHFLCEKTRSEKF